MQRPRPGIAKAAPFPTDLGEDAQGRAILHAILGELDALISRAAQREWAAFGWGTPKHGGVRLTRSSGQEGAECLRISWAANEIEHIEIESGDDISLHEAELPLDARLALERMVPMVWAHIRRGGELPRGIDRFASFL